jgi:hypothetical protein
VVSHAEPADDAVRQGPTGNRFVSYREWAKLIATAFLASLGITTITFAICWWLIK